MTISEISYVTDSVEARLPKTFKSQRSWRADIAPYDRWTAIPVLQALHPPRYSLLIAARCIPQLT